MNETTKKKSNKRRADYADGRTLMRRHVRGKIYGRVNVGLYEPEWLYVVELAKESGSAMSDVVRWALESDRKKVEEEVFSDGEAPPWRHEAILMKRFSHVEITDD